ncbi:hypothetical protein AZA_24514 [Nitrospirillum viridazoti Y2]|nr:hypothetical protein AZA_24514 [Nitrospirillum amazonense Y2]
MGAEIALSLSRIAASAQHLTTAAKRLPEVVAMCRIQKHFFNIRYAMERLDIGQDRDFLNIV